MRFYIHYETQKKLLTAESYTELLQSACQMFSLSQESAQLFFIDKSDKSEISISSQDDFNEIMAEIEDLKSQGDTSKPVIKILATKPTSNPLQPVPSEVQSVTSAAIIAPIRNTETETAAASNNESPANKEDDAGLLQ